MEEWSIQNKKDRKKKIFNKNPPSMEVIENNLGGTPTENRSTLIPTDLAAIKCPNS